MLFVDLRDHYGITQLVFTPDAACYLEAAQLSRESVITVTGAVVERAAEAVNPQMETGQVELRAEQLELLSAAAPLPFSVVEEQPVFENTRLKYRFLDLRRQGLHRRTVLRAKVIASMRRRLTEKGFSEYQTPILTSASPEGARDFLVPSRLHPGEFYQLDLEMAFVEQEDVFQIVEDLFAGIFGEFGTWETTPPPFPRIPYAEALQRYGTDKPDLRFELEIEDVSDLFAATEFRLFRQIVEQGGVVRALCVPQVAQQPRSFFDNLRKYIEDEGGKGLAYLVYGDQEVQGPIAAALGKQLVSQLGQRCSATPGSALFFIADTTPKATDLAGKLRLHLADLLMGAPSPVDQKQLEELHIRL